MAEPTGNHAIEEELAMQAVFAVFDSNGDGLLDKAEVQTFATAFRKPNAPAGSDNIDKIMESMDFENSDNQIQFPEFETYVKAVLDAKFASYDHTAKGYLTIDNMIDVVNDLVDPNSKEMKRPHAKEKKKKLFMRKFDKQGDNADDKKPVKDGKVTQDEFRAFFLQEMQTELVKWAKGKGEKPLPYMLRQAVNVNPGQVSKQVKQLEKLHDETVAEQKKAGVYVSPEDEVYDLTDVKDTAEMKESEQALVVEKKEEMATGTTGLSEPELDTLKENRVTLHTGAGGVYKEEEQCCNACALC